jgi:hypothetical protein
MLCRVSRFCIGTACMYALLWLICQFFLYIIIIIIILLIIRVIKINFKIYEWQRATSSGVEQTCHCQCRFYVKRCKRATACSSDHNFITVGSTSLLPPKTSLAVTRLQRHHWQWCVYTVLHKDATGSDAFAPRHYQWRAAIRKF